MIRIVLAVIAIAFGISAVVAQGDPIAARKALMKANGDQNRIGTEMIDGKQPFEVAKAKAALMTISDNAAKMPPLFPANSKDGDTAALPVIWEKKADFDAKMTKFSADAKAAAGKVSNAETLKTEVGDVRKNCGGCHNEYRKKS